ncbi:hypothetical protein A2625_01025 [candidate division WOR-1 bacterium RIFCSPHIGHO2_01_FULL_53_15]|uniref:Uncharacterized protein n=1 Tax=candidate division WOR-1 bacterium RIFCSPHIGHO2_01_FULL_53_15 TaxID=1802564 RepID=A0A1F4Q0C9_UNCSA|nr:MAG: hypothetical protein A2625_01025 [candidate division WOR-1 bacterium RIFCSPHIGHO2_01_FULL_53_15]OGC10730.1 MAG: hypothetical protein A3D23_04535 [candidate division WOR-1 bacterium RIFCSPHIGHO2_02_FULL_53_26]
MTNISELPAIPVYQNGGGGIDTRNIYFHKPSVTNFQRGQLSVPDECVQKKGGSETDYHVCLLERNRTLLRNERARVIGYITDIISNAAVESGLVAAEAKAEELTGRRQDFCRKESEPYRPAGVIDALEILAVDGFGKMDGGFLIDRPFKMDMPKRDAKLLMTAARWAIDMFFISAKPEYLTLAEQFLRYNLATNVDHSQLRHLPYAEKKSHQVYPVHDYIQTQLFLLQALSLHNPGGAIEFSNEIEAMLDNPDCLASHGIDDISREGYLNQIRIFKGYRYIFNPPSRGLAESNVLDLLAKSVIWSGEKQGRFLPALWWVDEMSRKDLRFDELTAELLNAHIKARDKLTAEDAISAYKVILFDRPETTRKYGGFLKIGLEAFFGILIACFFPLDPAAEPDPATEFDPAAEFEKYIDWDKLYQPKYADLREALGLLVREESRFSRTARGVGFDWDPTPKAAIGNLGLELGLRDVALQDNTPVKYEFDIRALKTPRERLNYVVDHLLDFVLDLDDSVKNRIRDEMRKDRSQP